MGVRAVKHARRAQQPEGGSTGTSNDDDGVAAATTAAVAAARQVRAVESHGLGVCSDTYEAAYKTGHTSMLSAAPIAPT